MHMGLVQDAFSFQEIFATLLNLGKKSVVLPIIRIMGNFYGKTSLNID